MAKRKQRSTGQQRNMAAREMLRLGRKAKAHVLKTKYTRKGRRPRSER